MSNSSQNHPAKPFPRPVVLSYSAFIAVLIPVYWIYRGPQNFLWGCDIALFMTLYALWRQSSLLASMAILVTLIPDVVWLIDFVVRLRSGYDVMEVGATAYMLEPKVPLAVRALSFFHLFLAPLLLWMLFCIGYDRRAIYWQTGVAWLVLPLSYGLTDPERNINWVYGFGSLPPVWLPGPFFVAAMMVAVPALVFWPTHMLMRRLFSGSARLSQEKY